MNNSELASKLYDYADYLLEAEGVSPNLGAHRTEKSREVLGLARQAEDPAPLRKLADELTNADSFSAMRALLNAAADALAPKRNPTPKPKKEAAVPAHEGLKTPTGITTAQNLAPQSTLLKAIGTDGLTEIFREDLVVDKNTTSLSWDGSKFTLASPRNAWVFGAVVIESNTSAPQQFTAAIDQLTRQGGGSIQNTSAAYADHANRPLQLFHPGYVPINGLSHFQSDSYDDQHNPPRYQSSSSPPTAATREALGKHKPNGIVDMTVAGNTQTVNAGQSYLLWFRLWIAGGSQVGNYNSAITLTDSVGGVVTVPIELAVDGTVLSGNNDVPMYSYLQSSVIGERATGTLNPVAGSAAATQQKIMIDETAKLARSCRVTPLFDEFGGGPVPTAEHEPRLLGQLYSGTGYIGPGVSTPLDVMFLGMYGGWANWSGVGGHDAVVAEAEAGNPTPAAIATHLANFETWRAANFSGPVYAYLLDEAHDESLVPTIDKFGEWFGDYITYATTGSTLVSPVPNYEYFMANAPNVNHIAIAAPIMPKRAGTQIDAYVAGSTAAQPREVSIYNGIGPMTTSYQLDDIQAGPLLNHLGFQKIRKAGSTDRLHGHLMWGFAEWRNREGGGQFSGAPTGTYINPGDNRGRPNLWRTGNSFGHSDISVDRGFDGHSGYLYCEGDGHLCIPMIDAFGPQFAASGGSNDSFGVESAAPTVRLFQLCRALQDAQLAAQARVVDNAAVQAELSALIPTFGWELGVTNDGQPNEERSYKITKNPLHSINTDDIVAFTRAQLARAN